MQKSGKRVRTVIRGEPSGLISQNENFIVGFFVRRSIVKVGFGVGLLIVDLFTNSGSEQLGLIKHSKVGAPADTLERLIEKHRPFAFSGVDGFFRSDIKGDEVHHYPVSR
jgi:hypothetical protein